MARFVRKHPDATGVHIICKGSKIVDGKEVLSEIKIEGRQIYETDDKKEIELLRKDEMIEEVNKKAMIEAQED